jgi:hypothetical protein
LPSDAAIVFEDANLMIESSITNPIIIRDKLNPPVSVDTILGIDVID